MYGNKRHMVATQLKGSDMEWSEWDAGAILHLNNQGTDLFFF